MKNRIKITKRLEGGYDCRIDRSFYFNVKVTELNFLMRLAI